MWTEDRREELGQLRLLLDDMKLLDKATGTLCRLSRIQEAAAALSVSDVGTGRASFALFLAEQQADWPAKRQQEVSDVRQLLATAKGLDRASGMLTALRRIEAAAVKLTYNDLDTGRDNFPQFLVAQAFASLKVPSSVARVAPAEGHEPPALAAA